MNYITPLLYLWAFVFTVDAYRAFERLHQEGSLGTYKIWAVRCWVAGVNAFVLSLAVSPTDNPGENRTFYWWNWHVHIGGYWVFELGMTAMNFFAILPLYLWPAKKSIGGWRFYTLFLLMVGLWLL